MEKVPNKEANILTESIPPRSVYSIDEKIKSKEFVIS